MLDNSVAVVVVVERTRPRAIPLPMITMRKSTHGFPLLSYMSMGLRYNRGKERNIYIDVILVMGSICRIFPAYQFVYLDIKVIRISRILR